MTQSTHDQELDQNQKKSGLAKEDSSILCLAVLGEGKTLPTYWIRYDQQIVNRKELEEALIKVLVDSTHQKALLAPNQERLTWLDQWKEEGYLFWAEKQFQPGVTDNLSNTIEEALGLTGISSTVEVASGAIYLIGAEELEAWSVKSLEGIREQAAYSLYHPLVESFHVYDLKTEPPKAESLLAFPSVSLNARRKPEIIPLDLDDDQLMDLSRNRLLALSLDEMKVVRSHYKNKKHRQLRKERGMPEDPTDVELEIIAQTWSEHCKHKIFNAKINYVERKAKGEKPAYHQSINSLYKTYIKGATKKLRPVRQDLLSVFEDNSGIVKWDDETGVCFKVETHNSPSALEPYGGALTGILGVNRDILGTGLGARPIFNTDIFCFASPAKEQPQRPKLLPAETIPKGVRKGVEDGGNKSGIPTVNGAVHFHDGYRAKPLVFCGTGGVLPLKLHGLDHVFKHTVVNDRILMVGGRVGKDGIHGATFSSESLHEGSPVTAVQIGDPFTQKRVIDFVMAAQEKGLISGLTDNGAGGLSSSVGEMATITNGATIDLDKVPLKYPGLDDWEIVISESQERMTLSSSRVDELMELASHYQVEVSDIGHFHDGGSFEVMRGGECVASLELEFLHGGLPPLELEATWYPTALATRTSGQQTTDSCKTMLLELLGHENISSREKIVRQYDHEVQGKSVIKQFMGAAQQAPCDAAVILPVLTSRTGLVVSNGLTPQWSELDPHLMAIMAVDEAIRNGVCVGADPRSFSLLDNFCWPDPVLSERNHDGDYKLGQLVRACQGLYEACLAFTAPLISGKDSMKNDFDDGVLRLSIPPTLLVSAIARVEDVGDCISSELKQADNAIYLLVAGEQSLTGSHWQELYGDGDEKLPSLDLEAAPALYGKLHLAIKEGLVTAAHDLSEGGLAVALAEMVIGSECGAEIQLDALAEREHRDDQNFLLFAEGPGRILVEIRKEKREQFEQLFGKDQVLLGRVTAESRFKAGLSGKEVIDTARENLTGAWRKGLPFN